MEIRELSFFQTFECLGGKCPETCCRGWIIPLEAEDAKRMKQERGLLGLRLFLATYARTRDSFNSNSNVCPFFTREGLCGLQLKKGHDFLPEACRSYPRFYRNYDLFEERMLDLSCIGAARLWFANCRDLTFTVHDGTPDSGRCCSNDDPAFLQALLSCREQMKDALFAVQKTGDLVYTLHALDCYAEQVQAAFLNGNTDYLTKHPFEAYVKTAGEPVDTRFIFPYEGSLYHDLLRTHLYADRLSFANPTLYELCHYYMDAESSFRPFVKKWPDLVMSFFERYPHYAPYYAALFAYYLYQHFLDTYDDYSFRRCIRMGLVHLNMILLFDVLYEQENKGFHDDDFARIIAVYNRRAHYNDQIKDEMYRVVEDAEMNATKRSFAN